jgi:hypothetical protein
MSVSREKGTFEHLKNVYVCVVIIFRYSANSFCCQSYMKTRKLIELDNLMSNSADQDQPPRQRRGGWSSTTLFVYVRTTIFA